MKQFIQLYLISVKGRLGYDREADLLTDAVWISEMSAQGDQQISARCADS